MTTYAHTRLLLGVSLVLSSMALVACSATKPATNDATNTLLAHYTGLGVEESVARCYVKELTALGVTDLEQLESNQTVGAKAADKFDVCASSGPTTTKK